MVYKGNKKWPVVLLVVGVFGLLLSYGLGWYGKESEHIKLIHKIRYYQKRNEECKAGYKDMYMNMDFSLAEVPSACLTAGWLEVNTNVVSRGESHPGYIWLRILSLLLIFGMSITIVYRHPKLQKHKRLKLGSVAFGVLLLMSFAIVWVGDKSQIEFLVREMILKLYVS